MSRGYHPGVFIYKGFVILSQICIIFLCHNFGQTNSRNCQRFVNSIKASEDTLNSILQSENASVANGGNSKTIGSESCSNESECRDAKSSVAPVMVSGAGHDAMAIAEISHMGMLFVRCRGGVSHSPLEHVEPDDVAAASAALYHYIVNRC